MTQANPIIGSGQSGSAYRGADNGGKQALLNHHKGSSAPSYAEAGVLWLDDSATPWLLKMYDGADWIVLAAVNASTNAVTPYQGAAALGFLNYAADTGAANAYAVAPSPAVTAYAAGQVVLLKPGNANTGASTLAVSGLSAKSVKMPDGSALVAGALLSSGVYALIYDGANFVLLSSAGASSGTLYVTDQRSSGTSPGGAGQGTWATRTLNTVNRNTIPSATHSAGVVSLPAGTYSVSGSLVIYNTGAMGATTGVARLRDTTNNVTLAAGLPEMAATGGGTALLTCGGFFTLAGTASIELQYYCNATGTPFEGRDSGSGDIQVWASLSIRKES